MSDEKKVKPLGKVLVVGGCGFLGSHIVNLLVERHPQSQVSVLDLRTNLNRHASSRIAYHDGDITDAAALKTVFSKVKPDAVFHTASPHFNAPPKVHDKVNVEGTQKLLAAAQEAGVKAFVYTSSASIVLTAAGDLVNADETYPRIMGADQPEHYTTTKALAEIAVLEANRSPATFLTAAIRPAGIIGEGDVQIIPPIVQAYRSGSTKYQVGENENLFDFTYVGNIAYGHVLAAEALIQTHSILPTVPLDTERVDGEPFFITNGQPVYFWDFARCVWHEAGDRRPLSQVWKLPAPLAMAIGFLLENIYWVLGKKAKLTTQQVRYSTLNKYHNISKAKNRLGYEPLVDLDEGVRRGVKYQLEQEAKAAQKKGQ